MLRSLPEPVRRYSSYSGVVGRPSVVMVRLMQTGRMQPNCGATVVPVARGRALLGATPRVRLGRRAPDRPFAPLVRARDMYREGAGNMLIKAVGLFRIADVVGPEMDQGLDDALPQRDDLVPDRLPGRQRLVRAPGRHVIPRDAHGRRQDRQRDDVLRYGAGRLVDLVAERYRTVEGVFALERWSTPVDEYGELARWC